MHSILIVGAGKIGSLVAVLLANTNDYKIYLADTQINNIHTQQIANQFPNLKLIQLDAENTSSIGQFVNENKIETIVSSLPYFCNTTIAKLAKQFDLNYFDLTEDTQVAKIVTELAKDTKKVFVPQCGLAPGFISIVANDLMQHFSTLHTVKMRVGALPTNISNALQYSLTWSTDGLINEYGNTCNAIENGEFVTLFPLDNLEEIKIDGLTYEAFNTSGGIGSLATTYFKKIKNINYKTIRYPGHCAKMRFLMNDLNLNQDRSTLKRILENALPKTSQDVVLVYVSVTGEQNKQLSEENYVKKFYPKNLYSHHWSAIQLTTACSLAAVIDIVLSQPNKYQGFVKQEHISLQEFIANRFGQYYA